MKHLASVIVFVVMTFFVTQHGVGQTSDELKGLKDEIKVLKEGQRAIQKDLQEIKALLRSRMAQPQAMAEFKETLVSTENSYFKGKNDAKVVLIEFSDYQ
jgi:hypothetical protein